jgi:hypothetical protein
VSRGEQEGEEMTWKNVVYMLPSTSEKRKTLEEQEEDHDC